MAQAARPHGSVALQGLKFLGRAGQGHGKEDDPRVAPHAIPIPGSYPVRALGSDGKLS